MPDDDDRPRSCADHRWSAPTPRLVTNPAGELVPHPTEKMRFCMACAAEVTVEPERR